jgi:hypothetical protein
MAPSSLLYTFRRGLRRIMFAPDANYAPKDELCTDNTCASSTNSRNYPSLGKLAGMLILLYCVVTREKKRRCTIITDDTREERKEIKGKPPRFDATDHLQRTLPRHAGDILKIVRIPHTDRYRVNWYDTGMRGKPSVVGLTIHYIRESQFLICRLNESGVPVVTYPPKQ